MTTSTDRKPVADQAEDDAWFPSPFSLTQYVPPKTDFDGANYPNKYTGGKWKVLVIATQERYLRMDGGEFFSTGNHPVEMLLPVLHLDAAGFEVDVATISGDPVKLEMWAFPKERRMKRSRPSTKSTSRSCARRSAYRKFGARGSRRRRPILPSSFLVDTVS